ncbi:hypothetical protein [Haladaptatus sp. NG-SE-30]
MVVVLGGTEVPFVVVAVVDIFVVVSAAAVAVGSELAVVPPIQPENTIINATSKREILLVKER